MALLAPAGPPAQAPGLVAFLAACGGLGGLLAALAGWALLRQNRRLLTAQAAKAEAEGGASMVQSAMALVDALRREEEGCRKRLAEMADRQEEGRTERERLAGEVKEIQERVRFLEGLIREGGRSPSPAE